MRLAQHDPPADQGERDDASGAIRRFAWGARDPFVFPVLLPTAGVHVAAPTIRRRGVA